MSGRMAIISEFLESLITAAAVRNPGDNDFRQRREDAVNLALMIEQHWDRVGRPESEEARAQVVAEMNKHFVRPTSEWT